jgi:hypothetical protein
MKRLVQVLAVMLLVIVISEKNYAQDNEQPLLIVSFNQVSMSNMGTVGRIADSLFVPVLKELVDEGMIYSFGQFTHLWGDEWNYNLWYTAKDMASFDKFWDEYVSRVSDRHPGAFAAITKYFNAHKDNIYSIRNQYPLPPAR